MISHSPLETILLGTKIGKQLPENSVICLFGDLGSGKTTFIKGLVEGITGISHHQVNSPTFVYMNIYSSPHSEKKVYHFDLYRLHEPSEFLSMGFEEFFFAGGVCCLEWSERIENILPESRLCIYLNHQAPDERQIIFEPHSLNFSLNL